MKVLLLTQVLPYPLDSGPKIKTYHVIKHLTAHHRVTLVSFTRRESAADIEHLRSLCDEVYVVPLSRSRVQDVKFLFKSYFTREPFIILRDHRSEMVSLLRHLISEMDFDIVHADQLNMAQYAKIIPDSRKILDAHNALWLLYKRLWKNDRRFAMRLVFGRDWKLLKEYERDIADNFDRIITVSNQDRTALIDAGVQPEKIKVIPIAIDCECINLVVRDPEPINIIHIGTMFWPPNSEGVQWFLDHIWPLIHQEEPGVEFDVVGANPPSSIVRFGEENSGVNVWGYLEDPLPLLRKAAVMVVPLKAGSGMRVKILKAMAEGIPVVATSIGCEGISVRNGVHLLKADDPQAFAQATLRLIHNRGEADRIVRNARRLVEREYNFKHRLVELDRIYEAASHNGSQG